MCNVEIGLTIDVNSECQPRILFSPIMGEFTDVKEYDNYFTFLFGKEKQLVEVHNIPRPEWLKEKGLVWIDFNNAIVTDETETEEYLIKPLPIEERLGIEHR